MSRRDEPFDEPLQRYAGTATEHDEGTLHWREALDLERAEKAQIRHDEAGR